MLASRHPGPRCVDQDTAELDRSNQWYYFRTLRHARASPKDDGTPSPQSTLSPVLASGSLTRTPREKPVHVHHVLRSNEACLTAVLRDPQPEITSSNRAIRESAEPVKGVRTRERLAVVGANRRRHAKFVEHALEDAEARALTRFRGARARTSVLAWRRSHESSTRRPTARD